MSTNYLSVVSCAHCGEMIITAPDGTINCACTARRSCKHREGMSDCHECTIADLEAENARLQERVEEAVERGVRLLKSIERLYEERRLIEEDFSPEAWEKILQGIERAETERDGYKALAERRGEALEADVQWFVKQWELYMNCGQRGAAEEVSVLLDGARAAIAATPEEPCKTCGGSRVAPVDDSDLGGKGVTMSLCPDCQEVRP